MKEEKNDINLLRTDKGDSKSWDYFLYLKYRGNEIILPILKGTYDKISKRLNIKVNEE